MLTERFPNNQLLDERSSGHVVRVAMIGRDLPRPNTSGGVSGQVHLLARALVNSGNQVTVFALNPPASRGGYDYQPIPIPPFLQKHRSVVLYLASWGARSIPLDSFDVIHAHGEDQFIKTARPVVRTFYGSERAEARFSTTLRRRLYHMSMVPLERFSERRASAVVAISKSTQSYLAREAQIIPCGYDPAVFHPGGEKSAHPSVLFVGDFGTRKRAELLLEVFEAEVMSAIPDAELWMVTSAGIVAPGVRSLSRVSDEALASLYRQAWVYCMPSSYEGFGMPYLEAMASGTPVVATPNGGAEEVLDMGRTGRIVKDRDLGAELVGLLGNKPARAELSASGLSRAKNYQISLIANHYLELYQGLVDGATQAKTAV